MKELDSESQEFIQWAKQQLADWSIYEDILDDAEAYYAHSTTLVSDFEDKLIAGAKEHGKIDPDRDYDREIRNEALDLIGWTLMKKWIEKKEHDTQIKTTS